MAWGDEGLGWDGGLGVLGFWGVWSGRGGRGKGERRRGVGLFWKGLDGILWDWDLRFLVRVRVRVKV
ncbi:predicted protein [Sclerotinia sclerotiorum 1980 UF-70]|uniref:Uncharacterized protein n=1 Tax=Sclerotinia sclerotiorum (strain ATCC 18683 / 1980 / Ss-1) TaxID=665079 RepID=A7EM36_SCLS1|nr:predicted protein [Sclerotinia sclerotiorum 1980 UF-70]EDO03902.1 predicted protein [Sclerotinia sclerotiorum 1980 UF-70]